MIDQVRDLEDLKSAAAALQARIAVGFDAGQRRAQAEAGVPADERGKGVGAQIALARRESPARGSRLLGLARALVTEMPRTLAALSAGELNERRVAPGHPASPSTPPLPGTRTPSPGRGDGRSRGQIMADDLVERITGTPGGITGIEIQLVMTDRTLLQGDSEPARLPGYGIVPAAWARAAVRDAAAREGRPAAAEDAHIAEGALSAEAATGNATVDVWLRRLYTAPGTGELTAMDSRARLFPAGLRRFIRARDHTKEAPGWRAETAPRAADARPVAPADEGTPSRSAAPPATATTQPRHHCPAHHSVILHGPRR
ncbi:13E12 repeat family protein [Arthrobacter sp. KBS0703]|uniref:13E12 repeat family protein n=1 Tax=Arthrobacter sp. KBS0703 TaxID=1955698 RepID=UPI0021B10474|nr:13E12 repeat family protein [Arthrobacter sp. KBS0703]